MHDSACRAEGASIHDKVIGSHNGHQIGDTQPAKLDGRIDLGKRLGQKIRPDVELHTSRVEQPTAQNQFRGIG